MQRISAVNGTRLDAADELAALINAAYEGSVAGAVGWTRCAHLLGGDRITGPQIQAMLREPDGAFLQLRDNDCLMGCVHVQRKTAGIGEIGLLAIHPAAQSRGAGRRLLAAAEHHLCSVWALSMAELTVLEPRPELVDWYRRSGYEANGQRRPLRTDGEGYGIPLAAGLEVVGYRRRLR